MSSGVANDTSTEILVEQQGTVTSLRRMPRSTGISRKAKCGIGRAF